MAEHEETKAGHTHLAHHFATPQQQFESGKTGMWLFLSTEVLLFSGLFCAYAVYRANHPDIFIYAHQFLDKRLGGLNTLILILSSLTAAWAVRAAQLGRRRQLVGLILATLFCACCFLGIKAVEYEHKWKHGLLWGRRYHPTEEVAAAQAGTTAASLSVAAAAPASSPAAAGAAAAPASSPAAGATPAGAAGAPTAAVAPAAATSPAGSVTPPDPMNIHTTIPPAGQPPAGLARPALSGGRLPASPARAGVPEGTPPRNVQIFFGIYFAMTGLHGIHVIAGMIAWIVALRRTLRGEFGPDYYTPIDLTALYWHLVDLIWIYLFPLLYLIR